MLNFGRDSVYQRSKALIAEESEGIWTCHVELDEYWKSDWNLKENMT